MHHFSYSDLELAQKTKAQGQNIFSGHRQSLCQIFASNHFPLQDMAKAGFMHYFDNDPELALMTLGQNHGTLSGLKQSLWEVGASNVCP